MIIYKIINPVQNFVCISLFSSQDIMMLFQKYVWSLRVGCNCDITITCIVC